MTGLTWHEIVLGSQSNPILIDDDVPTEFTRLDSPTDPGGDAIPNTPISCASSGNPTPIDEDFLQESHDMENSSTLISSVEPSEFAQTGQERDNTSHEDNEPYERVRTRPFLPRSLSEPLVPGSRQTDKLPFHVEMWVFLQDLADQRLYTAKKSVSMPQRASKWLSAQCLKPRRLSRVPKNRSVKEMF